MSSKQKVKGYKFENKIVKDLRSKGFKVQRLGQPNQPDILIHGFGTGECKCWAQGMKFAYSLIKDNEFAVIKWQSKTVKGKKPIVLLDYELFKELLTYYLKIKNEPRS